MRLWIVITLSLFSAIASLFSAIASLFSAIAPLYTHPPPSLPIHVVVARL